MRKIRFKWRKANMSKTKMDIAMDYLVAGGKFFANIFSEVYNDRLDQEGEEAYADAIEIGRTNTIAALYDSDVNDDEIIRVLNKFWGITKDEAVERLLFEKRKAVYRELEHYLKMQGFSSADIIQFMRKNEVSSKIKYNHELLKLRRNPEKLMKEVQK